MTGNVWEWVNSSAYNQTRILRGGSFASLERTLENTRTSAENPTARLQDVGFRCARSFS
jgi:formylglycine-generating enzyme required for sulfatase activity